MPNPVTKKNPTPKLKIFLWSQIVLLILTLSILNIFTYFAKKNKVVLKDTLKEELTFWEDLHQKYPEYEDAKLQIAEIQKLLQ